MLPKEGIGMANTVLLSIHTGIRTLWAKRIEVPTRINSAWTNQGKYPKGDIRNREKEKIMDKFSFVKAWRKVKMG